MIPLFIVEEHNEAFLIWNRAVLNNILSPKDNALLHIDFHMDFDHGVYDNAIYSGITSESELYEFTKTLHISNFITPAIYQGIFNDVLFVTNMCPQALSYTDIQKKILYRHNNELFVNRLEDIDRMMNINPTADYKIFTTRNVNPLQALNGIDKKVVIDIDLDYFSCDDRPSQSKPVEIEITYNQYKMLQDPYNTFNIFHKKKWTSFELKGRYFIQEFPCKCNQCSSAATPISDNGIQERMDKIIRFLEGSNFEVSLINICRSRYSGYTPDSQWKNIEDTLINRLSSIYQLSKPSYFSF